MGWTIGGPAFATEGGGLGPKATAVNGEDLIRAQRPTHDVAW